MTQRKELFIWIVTAVTVTLWAYRPIWNIDIFWHIATGRVILESGIPETDIFAPPLIRGEWTPFQWGYEALVAWIDDSFGLSTLRWIRASIIGAAAGLFGLWSRERGATILAAIASITIFICLFEDRIRVRPHLFEPMFVILTILACRRGKVALLALLIAPIWANVHAVSSLWWIAIFGAWTLSERTSRAYLVLAGGIAAIALSPGAIEGLIGALGSHSEWPAEFVPELNPIFAYATEGAWGWLLLTIVAGGVVCSVVTVVRSEETYQKLLSVGCALAAVVLARWAFFAAIPIAIFIQNSAVKNRLIYWLAIGVTTASLALHVGPRWSISDRSIDIQANTFPEGAVDFMEETNIRVPTDTTGSWAGYLLYRLHPPATVIADGRLVFSDAVADLLRRRSRGDAATFDEAVGYFHTQALLRPTGTTPALSEDRWLLVYGDEIAELWLPSPAWLPERMEAIEQWNAQQ